MGKLHKLKDWFSLEDAAKRLSSGLQEPVSVEDIIQLALEGHLPLSWYARHVPARQVTLRCTLIHMLDAALEKGKQKEYIGEAFWHGDCAYRLYAGYNKDDVLMPYASLGWGETHETEAVVRLDGPYRLELSECGALKEWIHSLLTSTGGELISLDGFYVSDRKGSMWRIMEYCPEQKYTDPRDGSEKTGKAFFCPSGEFPDPAELVIQRIDIETFESRITADEGRAERPLPERAETTYQNIIGGLVLLMLGRTPAGKPQSVYQSQAAIIEALLAHHEGKPGISRRTLEEKFSQAKRMLDA